MILSKSKISYEFDFTFAIYHHIDVTFSLMLSELDVDNNDINDIASISILLGPQFKLLVLFVHIVDINDIIFVSIRKCS